MIYVNNHQKQERARMLKDSGSDLLEKADAKTATNQVAMIRAVACAQPFRCKPEPLATEFSSAEYSTFKPIQHSQF